MCIGLKNKFFILFHTLLLVLLLGSFSTSYAMSKSEAFEYCRDNCGYASMFNSSGVEYPQYNLIGYDNYLTYLDNDSHNVFFVSRQNNIDSFDIFFYDTLQINGNTYSATLNNNFYSTTKRTSSFNNLYDIHGSSQPAGTFNLSLPTAANSFYMIYADGFIVAASFDLPLTSHFEPNHDYIVSVNNIDYVNCLLRNWSINQWQIGKTVDFIDLNSYSMYFYDEINNVEIGTLFVNNNQNTLINNGALYYSNGDLYVNSRLISHNVLYRLYIEKWLDGVQTSEEYYFIFLPRNAVVSNGQIISVGSGDFSVQDSTNNIIASQESGDEKIIEALTDFSEVDSILSGEFTSNSGDIEKYAEKFGFTSLDNPFTTFLIHILDSTFDALTEPNNVVLSADYKNLYFELNSDDFTTPASPAKDFIRNLLIFLYIYGNYRFFNHLLILIQTAKIDKAIATLGTDEFYDSDIM